MFDIIWIDGRDVTALPLTDRRRLLGSLLFTAPLHRVMELAGDAPWEQACAGGWEGVIAKRRDSVYQEKRSTHWLKMKCELSPVTLERVHRGIAAAGFFQKNV